MSKGIQESFMACIKSLWKLSSQGRFSTSPVKYWLTKPREGKFYTEYPGFCRYSWRNSILKNIVLPQEDRELVTNRQEKTSLLHRGYTDTWLAVFHKKAQGLIASSWGCRVLGSLLISIHSVQTGIVIKQKLRVSHLWIFTHSLVWQMPQL